MIEISTPAGAVEAAYTTPESGTGPWPGVLLCIDAIGLRPRIEEMCRVISSWGYAVLAPNVFHRSGTAAQLAPDGPLDTAEKRAACLTEAGPRMADLTPELVEQDLPAYLDALAAMPEVGGGPLGVVGYCMGAQLAVRSATLCPDRVLAVGAFHGAGLATEQADSPHRQLSRARARFAFGHADDDPMNPPEQIAELGAALDAAGLQASNQAYAGAQHGFTMADTLMYDEVACGRHFVELRELFDATL